MYDILSNHKVIEAVAIGELAVGAETSTAVDLFTGGCANRLLVLVDVTSVGTGGTLDLIIQDSTDDSTYDADFVTVDQIDATGLYMFVVDDPNRYVKVNATAGTDAVSYGVKFVTFEEQRRPVTQSVDMAAVTYGEGRTSKVASA